MSQNHIAQGGGRPPGEAPVIVSNTLRLDDLAVIRAIIEGVPIRAAADRYWPDGEQDLRLVVGRVKRAVRAVGLAMANMPSSAQTVEDAASRALATTEHAEQESFDAFAARYEGFSEREILEAYQEQYGAVHTPDAPSNEAIEALNYAQSRFGVSPKAGDAIGRWLSEPMVKTLIPLGVVSLGDLLDYRRIHSSRYWWMRVDGLGRVRAARLDRWLHEHFGNALMPTSQPWALAPTEPLQTRTDLRAGHQNALGVANDDQAVKAWLSTLTLKSSNTFEAYARDVQRLCLWAKEQGKSFSGLSVEDAVAHVRFLEAPPAHWVMAQVHPFGSPGWRPMRGPLSKSSVHRALGAIKAFFNFMVQTRYLVANPFASLTAPGQAKTLDTLRYFTGAHLVAIQQGLSAMPESPEKTRLRALLMLLLTTGIRRASTAATWADVVMVPDGDNRVRCLRVCEKGNRERFIPLRDELMSLLEAHRLERQRLIADGVLSACEPEPLIGVLAKPLRGGASVATGSLSASGLHRVLKAFFVRAAKYACDEHVANDLLRASAHWGRHTFAHHALSASDNDLTVVQALLGHSSISTTGQYVKAAIRSRAQAIQAMEVTKL